MNNLEPKTYQEFWPFYLRAHANAGNRYFHFFGTTLTLFCAALAIYDQSFWWLIGMPLLGYGFAWMGHFMVEKNRPATFKYPFWSLYSDYRMYFLYILGRLEPHLKNAGIVIKSQKS